VAQFVSTHHQSWKAGFDSRLVYTEDLKNRACGLLSLVLDVDEWLQGNGSRADLIAVKAALAMKVAGARQKQADMGAAGHSRHSRKEYKKRV